MTLAGAPMGVAHLLKLTGLVTSTGEGMRMAGKQWIARRGHIGDRGTLHEIEHRER